MISRIFVVAQTGFRHEHLAAICRGSIQDTRKEHGKAIGTGGFRARQFKSQLCQLPLCDLEQVTLALRATLPLLVREA